MASTKIPINNAPYELPRKVFPTFRFFMSKYTADFKLQAVQEYLESTIGITSLAAKYGLSQSMLGFLCQRWSMDFVSDQLANGRRFHVLNVVDDYNRQLVSVSISGPQVARYLSQVIEARGRPKVITAQNTPVKRCSFGAKSSKCHFILFSQASLHKMHL